MTLTKDMLVDKIQEKLGFQIKESRAILEFIIEEIKTSLELGLDVKISGFGKWIIREKKSRPGRNPHTGIGLEIAARRVVTFHASDILRQAVDHQDRGSLPATT